LSMPLIGQTSKEDILHHYDKTIVDEKRRQRLEPIKNILLQKGAAHKFEFIHGEPGPSIVDFANKGDYDLIVVGSRGLNALQEMVLGSVSHKIHKRVLVPVMIVK
jgi:nucleotide-binding universal stress UspA family protein